MVLWTIVHNIVGIAIQPFSNQIEREELTLFCLRNKIKKVGFADLAPTVDIEKLILLFEKNGIKLKIYLDHHENSNKPDEIDIARGFYDMIGDDNFQFYPRESFAAATLMVEPGIWQTNQLDAVFFHDDADGWISFLKGVRKPVLYPWFNDVALFFEKGSGGKLSDIALRFVQVYQDAMNIGPPYPFSSLLRQRARKELYNNLTVWLLKGMNDEVISEYLEVISQATAEANQLTEELLATMKIEDGFVYVDCYDVMAKDGRRPNFPYLKREMFRKAEGYMLVAIRVLGHKGDQVSIFKPEKMDIYLPDLLPLDDKDWHVASRVNVRKVNFLNFKQNYVLAVERITVKKGS